jgi:tRNA A37 threonylcarbamoyltransferase TsaD
MLLLCIDTSTPQVGVAIGSDDQVIGRVQLARPQHHAEHLAPAIAYLLEQLDLSLDQLSGIGVGIGPGLFTGCEWGWRRRRRWLRSSISPSSASRRSTSSRSPFGTSAG